MSGLTNCGELREQIRNRDAEGSLISYGVLLVVAGDL
jgi:hypothetical protein